jgi:hypothetical protein
VPHFSRALREVGFHKRQPLVISNSKARVLIVWDGHSCGSPLTLTLILTLILILIGKGRASAVPQSATQVNPVSAAERAVSVQRMSFRTGRQG